jgi:hypothetical protein
LLLVKISLFFRALCDQWIHCLQRWDLFFFFTIWRGQCEALSLTNLYQRGPEIPLHSTIFLIF